MENILIRTELYIHLDTSSFLLAARKRMRTDGQIGHNYKAYAIISISIYGSIRYG